MGRHYVSACLAAIVLLALASVPTFALGRLKIHPSNPHYFQEDGTGRPILIASYTNMVPETIWWDDIAGMNYYTLRRRLSYCRVWHVGAYSSGGFLPWNFTSTPACGPHLPGRVDMDTDNPIYWTRMDNSLSHANNGDVYAQVMVFDRCSMSPYAEDRWQNNVWATDNNVHSLETTSCGTYPNGGTPGFYQWQTKPNLKYYQEAWIKKLIDETIQWPNVFYEVENEHWQSNSVGWADHYGQFIKDYIATYYPSSPRLVSYSSIESDTDLDQCYTMSAIDVVNPHWGDDLENNPSLANTYLEARWHYNKPMNVDEFANNCSDPNVVREICWTIVTSGGNFHIEDALDPARGYEACENIRHFMALSAWNFINAAPQKSLITSGGGYCMRNPGVEYVCYFPTGGSKTITLSAATYNVKWWNPRTGGFYNLSSFAHGGGSKVLSTPDSGDWVLHLTTGSTPTKVLTCKYATTAITIDGATNDWVPGQSKIRGGDAGTGNIGIVEFDTNGVCYVGGNLDAGGQVLPYSATDHSVTISSRYDASYVYFMVRCNDDDVRYSNPTSSNYLNDCVEFYIDPGNNGGATAISNSTSDVQLVIDANNQKNAYGTTAGYASQVLAGVTSAVVRDMTGWSLEVRIQKSVLDPDVPATGTIGIDFAFRDNDNNNDASMTTVCGWSDAEVSASFPTKIPNRWGDLTLESYTDSTAPAAVTGFSATADSGQVTLNWTKPSTSDYTGTVIRYKTGSYPTSVTDGALAVDKLGSPSGADSYVHTGLTGGVTYYYAAFAHDAALNYSTSATANATPTAVQVYWNTLAEDTYTLVGARTPSVAVDSSGNVHVVYMVGQHVFYRVGDANLNFGAAEQIPDTAIGAANYNSPHLVVDSNGIPHVVFMIDAGPDSHTVWYANRIGGSWDTPVTVIGNWNDGRANFPRLALGNGHAYVACFGAASGAPYWANGTLARVDNITTTPTAGKQVNIGYWVAHPFVNSSGDLFACGRAGGSGHKGVEFDSYSLAIIGTEFNLSNGVGDGLTGEEFGACMDSNGVIHGAGIVGRQWPLYVWYNNTSRGTSAILGMASTAPDWPDIDVYPTVTVDSTDTTYVSFRRFETGEGWATRIINNNAFDTPVVYASNVTSRERWNPQIAPTTAGGIYVAWEQSGNGYVRSVGRGTDTPDTTPPADVTNFAATAGSAQVNLSWTNPTSDFSGTMIRFSTTGYPTGVTDGTQVYNGSGTSTTHTGLTNGVLYYYKAFAHDAVPNYAAGVTASATPLAADNAQYIGDTIPATMTPGQVLSVSVTMKNTGTATWSEANSYRLGAVGDSDPFNAAGRIYLTGGETVAPQAQKQFTFTMTAPTTPATYTTDWRMVHDGVAWFGDTLTKQVVVSAGGGISTINTKSAANINLVIDGSSSDWVMGDFTTNSLGGQNTQGDIAVVGFNGGTRYYGGYNTALVLPTTAADHTGKVYSRHDQQYMYFLVRCDDDQMNYAQPASANWANDCIEFYIDPANDHGSTGLTHPGSSASDIQLVIDCNNQKNAYCVTSGYATQVLAGVTSAVVRDGTGWWLEAKVLKSAVDPDFPASGTFGVDFCFRDNDNPDAGNIAGNPAYSTMYGWRETPSGTGFPNKVPNAWGDASLVALSADTTPPAAVTSFTATPSTGQNALAWTNPATADWAGTQVRFKTTGYPTGPTDGTQIYNGTGTSYNHTSLTGGVTYYYCAYAYDEVPNYATAAQATGTVPGGGVSWQVQYEANAIPSASSPAWTKDVGSEDLASVASGILHVNDNTNSSQIMWYRSWNAASATGSTVEARMKCDTITYNVNQKNVELYDGTYAVSFRLRPTRLDAIGGTTSNYNLDATAYHTYRFTLLNGNWNAYLDGGSTPILSGTGSSTSTNRVELGARANTGMQSIYFDYLYYTTAGAYAP